MFAKYGRLSFAGIVLILLCAVGPAYAAGLDTDYGELPLAFVENGGGMGAGTMPAGPASAPRYNPERIIVKPKKSVQLSSIASLHRTIGGEVVGTLKHIGNLQAVRLPKGADVMEWVERYRKSPLVEYASPDYLLYPCETHPNDPYYTDGSQWALHNTGQSGGRPDADMDAPEAWDIIHDAPNVIVAVIDSGVRYTHEDLADNMWVNAAEDLNHNGKFDKWPSTEEREGVFGDLDNLDNDGNGYVDDVIGWDFASYYHSRDNDPMDTYGHGTSCASVIGAVGNNALGTVGVAWRAKIMALQCLGGPDSNGQYAGWEYDSASCIDYAIAMGASVISNSYGSSQDTYYLTSLIFAMQAARDAGVICVAAAGNNARNIDNYPYYPASFYYENIVSVAATDCRDTIASFSNYGLQSVDLGAPGVDIYMADAISDSAYRWWSGTSFATPHVAGVFALVKALYPTESHTQLIRRVLSAVDPLPILEGMCVTGGRLNLHRALTDPLNDLYAMPVGGYHFGSLAQGGPYTPSGKTYKLTNCGSPPIAWNASFTQSWVTASPSSGNLNQGESVDVVVSPNSGANALPIGVHTATLTFSGGGTVARDVKLTVGPQVYVKPDGNDEQDGLDWTRAKRTVQAAVDAYFAGQEVWVHEGTYPENLAMKPGTAMYGGFTGSETSRDQRNWTANRTILSGSPSASVIAIPSSTTAGTRIDGFTICNGGHIEYRNTYGGGIYCGACPITVCNNTIVNNSAYYGGGIYCYPGASPVIVNNVIAGNTSNTGGGIRIESGGIITNNTIVGNTAGYPTTEDFGGGIRCYDSSPTIANNIIAFNTSGIRSSGGSPSLRNNDFYGNTVYDYMGVSAGQGDIAADPLFVYRLGGNYHLTDESPCINAGWNSAPSMQASDIDGEPRIRALLVDIGAYEFQSFLAGIQQAKAAPDASWADFDRAVVSAAFPDYFYVESDNRSNGIRVEKAGHALIAGMRADVAGKVRTNSNYERYMEATSAVQDGVGSLKPISMPNRSLGGGDRQYNPATGAGQRGVSGSSDLNSIGLLVTTCGRVVEVDPAGTWIRIDDGSMDVNGVPVRPKVRLASGASAPALETYVLATGVISCELEGADLKPVILARYGSDVRDPSTPGIWRMYVTDWDSGCVRRYDGLTGAYTDTFVLAGSGGISGPQGLAFGRDGNLYVSSFFGHSVLCYSGETGVYLGQFVLPGSGGINGPVGLTFGPDGNLYVCSYGTVAVLKYHGSTGEFLGVFASLVGPPHNLLFGTDKHLYVTDYGSSRVLKYDGLLGTPLGVFAAGGGMQGPIGLAFGPNGTLYVGGYDSGNIVAYNGTTGAFIGVLDSGLNGPYGIVLGPDAKLYVAHFGGSTVRRYDPGTGEYLGDFVLPGSGGLLSPTYIVFRQH